MFELIDKYLDKITMYRLVLYYLIALVAIAAGLSAFKVLHYNPLSIIISASLLSAVCELINQVIARFFELPANSESSYITALILALIISPSLSANNIIFYLAVSGLAISSKYILNINKQHIFNPVAIAVVLTALGGRQSASWWVGSSAMLPYVLIGGLLIIRKIQRGKMVSSFLLAVLASNLLISLTTHSSLTTDLQRTIFHSSLVFLMSVMLVEPLTSPPTLNKQLTYGAIVGFLFPPQMHFFSVYSTPELALIFGNVYSYLVSPKLKLSPYLSQVTSIGPDVKDFVFKLDKPIYFKPGQYMEWTLGHDNVDGRGNRRYFTLASSPTENNLRLGVKFYPQGSSFKRAMLQMKSTTPILAGQLGGNFVMPDDPKAKLAFIAGGIGITPYRSMIKYLTDKNQQRDITLLYSEKLAADFAYRDVFNEAAQRLGLKVFYTLTQPETVPPGWFGQTGQISEVMIKAKIPDFAERYFYISGPHSMVTAVKASLHSLGISHSHIKTDFFPGYA